MTRTTLGLSIFLSLLMQSTCLAGEAVRVPLTANRATTSKPDYRSISTNPKDFINPKEGGGILTTEGLVKTYYEDPFTSREKCDDIVWSPCLGGECGKAGRWKKNTYIRILNRTGLDLNLDIEIRGCDFIIHGEDVKSLIQRGVPESDD